MPIRGAIDDLPDVIAEHNIHEVVLALPLLAQGRLIDLVRALDALPVNIRVVPDYSDLAFLHTTVEDFSGMPLIGLREPALTDLQRLIKRAFDIVMSLIFMAPALPLMAVIALAIRLDSPGPVLYFQERIGEGRKPFVMYKFRTMHRGADAIPPEAVAVEDDEGHLIYKHPDDPRVTRVGRWLRRTSLDELPQLFNVLRGEMSLVGPRPEMPWLVEKYEPWQYKRFEVPQGMTGWWQISGRADRPMYLYTEEDLFYIRNYSLMLDIQIIFRTIGIVLVGRGAY
ncbi:MAG: sugar transferase [Anaerolineae bacterium]|nr:sugar transferase [Anaerolineae bacterium]